jgi:hypothetical protein
MTPIIPFWTGLTRLTGWEGRGFFRQELHEGHEEGGERILTKLTELYQINGIFYGREGGRGILTGKHEGMKYMKQKEAKGG